MTDLPLVIEPENLLQHADNKDLLIIDMSKHGQYLQAHIPGAVFLDYGHIVGMNRPYMGLLPEIEQFSKILSAIGFTENKHIVAYDEEGGGKAARLIWTLHAIGHTKTSLLNGGLISWYKEDYPLSNEAVHTAPSHYTAEYKNMAVVADTQYILDHLETGDLGLLDARTAEEYSGARRYAEKAGRIPGAKHFEWTDGLDPDRNYRFLPVDDLKQKLAALELTDDNEIVVYCQTHHRSSLSYVMLKYMGYEHVKGYPGSWSEWGNRSDTPVEM
jgi:thiosulfate/3-mercaptopyruvate sulfurtransferase